MSEAKPVNVNILDKDYVVACPDEERAALGEAVEYLNLRIRELKEGGNIIGTERVAVMAALNITHEYLDYKRRTESYTLSVDAVVRRMQSKISGALAKEPAS